MMLLLTAGPFFTGSTATPDQRGDLFGLFNAKTLANHGRAAARLVRGTATQVLWCGAVLRSAGRRLLAFLLLAATGAGWDAPTARS